MDQSCKFLFLDEEQCIECGVMDPATCVEAAEDTLKLISDDDYLMGGPSENEHGQLIYFPEVKRGLNMPVAGPDRRFCAMIGYAGGSYNVCGEKWYGSNLANCPRGIPRSILTVILNDPDTSNPLAIMSGNLISQMRTGAMPGVASKYLTNPGAEAIGIIGAGVMSRTAVIMMMHAVSTFKRIYIYDVFQKASERFVKFCNESYPQLETIICNSIDEVTMQSDIIHVAASGEVLPTVNTDKMKEGGVLVLIGGASLAGNWIDGCTYYIDNWKLHKALIHEMQSGKPGIEEEIMSWAPSGAILQAYIEGTFKDSNIRNFGDVVTGKCPARKSPKDKIVYATCGMSIQDLTLGYKVYQNALKKGIGTQLKFWDKQYWFKDFQG